VINLWILGVDLPFTQRGKEPHKLKCLKYVVFPCKTVKHTARKLHSVLSQRECEWSTPRGRKLKIFLTCNVYYLTVRALASFHIKLVHCGQQSWWFGEGQIYRLDICSVSLFNYGYFFQQLRIFRRHFICLSCSMFVSVADSSIFSFISKLAISMTVRWIVRLRYACIRVCSKWCQVSLLFVL